jgi:predicted ester cyclase
VAEDIVEHAAPPGSPGGREGVKGVIAWLRAAFDGLTYEIEDVISSGDRVVVRNRVSGTHTGEFMGFAPTGRSFTVQQTHIFRVEDGRVAEHWANRDDLGMLRQLGLVGAPAPQAANASSSVG